MNRSEFLKLIENAGPSDRTMVGEVNELISIFPYFQSAYILLLKGLKNTSDVRFENQLRSSAMRIADREILYYFLGKEPARQEEPAYIAPSQAVNEDPVALSEQTVIESAKNSADLISLIEKNSIEKEQVSDQTGEHKEMRHSILVASGSDDEESVASIFIIDDEPGITEEKVFYMDPGFSVEPFPDLLELENDSYPDTETGPGLEENVENTNLKGRQLQTELIEKFIAANPRIEPVRTKPDAALEDISKPFVEEKGGLVTETLARIYINQGYYSRAIDIYEKLSLKFPEKSSYFASQIEKVKELIKK